MVKTPQVNEDGELSTELLPGFSLGRRNDLQEGKPDYARTASKVLFASFEKSSKLCHSTTFGETNDFNAIIDYDDIIQTVGAANNP